LQSTNTNHIQLLLKSNVVDVAGQRVRESAQKYLRLNTGKIKSGKIFSVLYSLKPDQISQFSNESLRDPIIQDAYINTLYNDSAYQSYILISKLPGVTDDEGISAQKALCDLLNIPFDFSAQWIFTQDIYYIENKLSDKQLAQLGEELLGNPLINHFEYGKFDGKIKYIPTVHIESDTTLKTIDIFVDDSQLEKLSKELLLALDLKEMAAIQAYFKNESTIARRKETGLPELPTDCEMEILAQTWSEHCKHKEFNAMISYKDLDTGEQKTIDSLFKTYIYKSTKIIQDRLKEKGNNWLLKIFSDNAGVVRIDDDRVFIWKVETHNSPSALDPYGGALTGIVGVNRDPLGTGIGGGKLLFNTNVLCFGSPYYDGKLLPGQLHPRQIMTGVVKGIEDGGNKSGIPTVNGSVIFDDRFRGKPLVFCGTGAVMPNQYNGVNSWEKPITAGDRIVMAGGRVGKDGIHGATFSSLEIDEHSPRSAVQIGSPITQKNMSDFMEQAVKIGLIKCSTDNGAGGLSSSIGELATISGGAQVQLDKVPLKYSGLKAWEIFVSESQERMSFVVKSDCIKALFEMAADFEVELTDIGQFTDTGFLDVRWENTTIAYLDLDFLHNGVPKKYMEAEWKKPAVSEPKLNDDLDYNAILLKLLGSLNICSRESIIRRYDHEVKGKSIIKPLMGEKGFAPQDAAIIRLGFDSYTGIAVSNGIFPKFGDIDAYEMSAGSFDEAVRGIIAVGGKLPDPSENDNNFWSVNDNFCLPDSAYNAKSNPDGKYKLAQLVRMNEALFDMSTFFNIPMTSGKDSMKNDFIKEGIKISVPPTILYSMVAKIKDVRNTLTAEFKQAGDLIYLTGKTYDELGGSDFYKLFNKVGANVPVVRKEGAQRIYHKMMLAHEKNLLTSAHDLSDGGLTVALAESAFGGEMGASIELSDNRLSVNADLFSESHSRFIVSVDPDDKDKFEKLFGDDATLLGKVSESPKVQIVKAGKMLIDLKNEALLNAWRGGLLF
jgi:phosphoribosylformylglycinamidine synthase II